jgi:hypothetical protein
MIAIVVVKAVLKEWVAWASSFLEHKLKGRLYGRSFFC